MKSYSCRICGANELGASYDVREYMFNATDSFKYDECGACHSLQLSEIPALETLAKFYPEDYYAFQASSGPSAGGLKARLRDWSQRERDKAALGGGGALASALNRIWPSPKLDVFRKIGMTPRDKVLDVGCGAGDLIDRLFAAGFAGVSGVDPFISADITTPAGARVKKTDLGGADGKFDLIMFTHSLEHVPSPLDELTVACEKLNADGRCLVRIPTPSSQAWRQYGLNWAQLDAPRHLTLPSRQGMTRLAQRCGFVLTQTIDEATRWPLMASELIQRGERDVLNDHEKRFTPAEVAQYEARAAESNAKGEGDSVAFLLEKAPGRR